MTRVAVVGLGEAGATIHLPALRGLDDIELVGAAEPEASRRAAVAERHGVPAFGDVDELLERTKPQLVIVASPPALHARHCLAALDAGADVLCEKPLAASVREGMQIVAHAAALGRRASVNYEFRAMPIYADLLAQIGAIGAAPNVAQIWQLIDHNPAAERGWRGSLRRRALYEAGAHLVDLALRMFGELPTAVTGTFSSSTSGSLADAIVLVTLQFSSGRLCQITQCRVHRGDRQYLEVRADMGDVSLRASFGGRARLSAGLLRSTRPHLALERAGSGLAWREAGATRRVLTRNGASPLVIAARAVIRDCLDAYRAGRPGGYPATDGVNSLRVIAAAYLAAELGRAVALDGSDRERIEMLPLAEAFAP